MVFLYNIPYTEKQKQSQLNITWKAIKTSPNRELKELTYSNKKFLISLGFKISEGLNNIKRRSKKKEEEETKG